MIFFHLGHWDLFLWKFLSLQIIEGFSCNFSYSSTTTEITRLFIGNRQHYIAIFFSSWNCGRKDSELHNFSMNKFSIFSSAIFSCLIISSLKVCCIGVFYHCIAQFKIEGLCICFCTARGINKLMHWKNHTGRHTDMHTIAFYYIKIHVSINFNTKYSLNRYRKQQYTCSN